MASNIYSNTIFLSGLSSTYIHRVGVPENNNSNSKVEYALNIIETSWKLIEEDLRDNSFQALYAIGKKIVESESNEIEKLENLGFLLYLIEQYPKESFPKIIEDLTKILETSKAPRFRLYAEQAFLLIWKIQEYHHVQNLFQSNAKDLPSGTLVFIIEKFSSLIFSNTGKINHGGLSLVIFLLNSNFGNFFQKEHRQQMLTVLTSLQNDIHFQNLLEQEFSPHPKMEEIIRASLRLYPRQKVSHIEAVRSILKALLHDLRQYDNQANCYAVATLITMLSLFPSWCAQKYIILLRTADANLKVPNSYLSKRYRGIFDHHESLPFDAGDLWRMLRSRSLCLDRLYPFSSLQNSSIFKAGCSALGLIHNNAPSNAETTCTLEFGKMINQSSVPQSHKEDYIKRAEWYATSVEQDILQQFLIQLFRFSKNNLQDQTIDEFNGNLKIYFHAHFLLEMKDYLSKDICDCCSFLFEEFQKTIKQKFWFLDQEAPLSSLENNILYVRKHGQVQTYQGSQDLLKDFNQLLFHSKKLLYVDPNNKRLRTIESFDELQMILSEFIELVLQNYQKKSENNKTKR